MLGAFVKMLGRGMEIGVGAGKGFGPAAFGKGVSRMAGAKAGFVAAHGMKGMLGGAAVGGAMWGATGNSDWMGLGMGAGAWMGGARAFTGASATFASGAKTGKLLGSKMNAPGFGWFAPGRLARNMGIGAVAGLATDNPEYAVYGAVGLPAAGKLAKFLANPKGIGTFAKGVAQIPFSPGAAARTLSGMPMSQVMAAPFAAGLAGGGAWGGFKLATNWGNTPNDVNSGRYPGGVAPLHPGRGQGIPNDNLSTEGLTLALHKQARKTRHI